MENIQFVCVTDNYEKVEQIMANGKGNNRYMVWQIAEEQMPFAIRPVDREEHQEKDAAVLLRKLGIPPNVSGYRFLMEAVQIGIDDPVSVESITKSIYPEIAKRCQTTSSRVERAIRHAIEVAWTRRGDAALQKEIFANSIDTGKCKPTNSQFVATLVDYILY